MGTRLSQLGAPQGQEKIRAHQHCSSAEVNTCLRAQKYVSSLPDLAAGSHLSPQSSPGIWTHRHGRDNGSTVPLAQVDTQTVTTRSRLTNSPASSVMEEPVEPQPSRKTSSLSPGLATRHDKPQRTEMGHLRELEEPFPREREGERQGRGGTPAKAVCSSCCGNTTQNGNRMAQSNAD